MIVIMRGLTSHVPKVSHASMQKLRILSSRHARGLMLGFCCALVVIGLSRFPLVDGLDQWLFDGCLHGRGVRSSSTNIVLVGLDEQTLNSLGKPLMHISPELGTAVAYVESQGAAAIGIDLIIPEQLRDYPELQPGGIGDPSTLGQEIYQAGNVVLAQWRLTDEWLRPLPQWQLKSLIDPAVTDLAFVNLTQDADRFVRRQRLAVEAGDSPIPSFALALASVAQQRPLSITESAVKLGQDSIPLDEEGSLTINFVGPPGTFRIVSFRDLLAAAETGGQVKFADGCPVEFSEAVVLFGATAETALDLHATPYANDFWGRLTAGTSGLMSGVEIQANLVATLLDRAFVRRLPAFAELSLLLVVGPLLGALFSRLNLEKGLLVALAHHFGWKWFAAWGFQQWSLRIEIVPMLLVGALVYSTTFAIRWKRLRRMMGMVKSEAVARALEIDPGAMDLKGEEREVTVLFADIRSFTTFSEQHTPHAVVKLLNAYFGTIVPCIEAQGGTLNTYMGDGIMVIFGAPLRLGDEPRRAVDAARAMIAAVDHARPLWAELGYPEMRIGVGIHTGQVLVGTVGSPHRLDYTAIGDAVNLAARVEAENKQFGTEILITEATYQQLPPTLVAYCSETPIVTNVKGKHESVSVRSVSPK